MIDGNYVRTEMVPAYKETLPLVEAEEPHYGQDHEYYYIIVYNMKF